MQVINCFLPTDSGTKLMELRGIDNTNGMEKEWLMETDMEIGWWKIDNGSLKNRKGSLEKGMGK